MDFMGFFVVGVNLGWYDFFSVLDGLGVDVYIYFVLNWCRKGKKYFEIIVYWKWLENFNFNWFVVKDCEVWCLYLFVMGNFNWESGYVEDYCLYLVDVNVFN